MREDLRNAYPDVAFRENGMVSEDLKRVFEQTDVPVVTREELKVWYDGYWISSGPYDEE